MGSSDDNALAETINGLYKTELIKPRGPWRNGDQVEFATAEWVDWFTGGSFSTAATCHRRRWRLPTTLKPSPSHRRAVRPVSLRTCQADSWMVEKFQEWTDSTGTSPPWNSPGS